MSSHSLTPAAQPGEEFCLRDVLRRWQLPEEYHACMAPEWRCELAAYGDTEAAQARACLAAEPLFVHEECGARVHSATGPCALTYVQRPEWNVFAKPRIAMTSGWGAPGTRVVSDEYVTLVESFSEVVHPTNTAGGPGKCANLQLFHRADPDAPRLPRLPELLDWPLGGLLGGQGERGSVRCDMATRISKRGALTWWHLDDGGEFVLQVCTTSDSPLQGAAALTFKICAAPP